MLTKEKSILLKFTARRQAVDILTGTSKIPIFNSMVWGFAIASIPDNDRIFTLEISEQYEYLVQLGIELSRQGMAIEKQRKLLGEIDET